MSTPIPGAPTHKTLHPRLPMDLVDAIRRLCTATGLSLAQVVEMLLRKSLAGGVLTVESPEQRVARVLRGDS